MRPLAIVEAFKAQSLIWHSDKTKTWAPADKLNVCNEIYKRIVAARDCLLDNSTRQSYRNMLPFLNSSVESQEEKAFLKEWKELKEIYKSYQEREKNPQTFAVYLNQLYEQKKAQDTLFAEQMQKFPQIVNAAQVEMEKKLEVARLEVLEAKRQLIEEQNKNKKNIELLNNKIKTLENENKQLQVEKSNLKLMNESNAKLHKENNELRAELAALQDKVIANATTRKETDSLRVELLTMLKQQELTNKNGASKTELAMLKEYLTEKKDDVQEVSGRSSFSQSTLFAIPKPAVGSVDKLTAHGLKRIDKWIGQFGERTPTFYWITLQFNEEKDCNTFCESLSNYYKAVEKANPKYVSTLSYHATNEEKAIKLGFMNCQSSYRASLNFKIAGTLMLYEFEDIFNTQGIEQIFRDVVSKKKIEEKDLPLEILEIIKNTERNNESNKVLSFNKF